MPGRWVPITWQGQAAKAWQPSFIADVELAPSVDLARRTERASAAAKRADERIPASWEPLTRMFLRAEGIASSDIEGLRAPMEEVAIAVVDDRAAGPTAGWIADNLAVVTDAVATSQQRLTIKRLQQWHTRLMRHGSLPAELVGRFRPSQGWIGGASPVNAVYVPPPAESVDSLMTDLVAFANRDDLDPVSQAAVLHAQFETIHPYGDGNGRLGRVLIGWLLARRLSLALPPPVSVLIARDPGGYLSSLLLFRQESPDPLISWFADLVTRAGEASLDLGEQVRVLLTDWDQRLRGLRADAAARRVAAQLPAQPVINAALAAEGAEVSERSARNAIALLVGRGILAQLEITDTGVGRPRSWWVSRELLELVTTWPS